jgi:hypothetical protein
VAGFVVVQAFKKNKKGNYNLQIDKLFKQGHYIKKWAPLQEPVIKKPFTIKPYPMKNHILDGSHKRKVAWF